MENFFSVNLVQNLLKFKIPLALSVLGIFFVSLGVISPSLNQSGKKTVVVEKDDSVATQTKIKVDVAGAVKNPGVYSLDKETRITDAIAAAGGFDEKADQVWVGKNLNLAAKLADGQKIFVAAVSEQGKTEVLGSQSQSNLINVNTASAAELDTLPGVGSVTAGKIIAGRPYQRVEELLDRKIVNTSTYNKIKDLVSVY